MGSNQQKLRIIIMIFLCLCFLIIVNMNANLQMKSQKGFATVWGRARYWQNSTTAKPIKQVRVKIIDFNTNQVLGEGKTDTNGEYWISIYLDGSRDIYAKILCESDVAIVKKGTSNNIYYYNTPIKTATEGYTTYLGIYYASIEDYYWWAMDYAIDEYNWLNRKVNWTRSQVEIKYPTVK